MTYEQIEIKTRDRRNGYLDSLSSGVFAVKGVRGTVTAGGKAFARRVGATWPERHAQRRFVTSAQGHGGTRVDKPFKPRRSGSGTTGAWTTRSDPAGIASRLQSIRGHFVSAELQLDEGRRKAGDIQANRLYGRRRITRQSTHGSKSGEVATPEKNANGSPATGRSTPKTYRHGTNQAHENRGIADFVPPRDKTPCFWVWLRPATGHLYRFAICTGLTGKRKEQ